MHSLDTLCAISFISKTKYIDNGKSALGKSYFRQNVTICMKAEKNGKQRTQLGKKEYLLSTDSL